MTQTIRKSQYNLSRKANATSKNEPSKRAARFFTLRNHPRNQTNQFHLFPESYHQLIIRNTQIHPKLYSTWIAAVRLGIPEVPVELEKARGKCAGVVQLGSLLMETAAAQLLVQLDLARLKTVGVQIGAAQPEIAWV